MCAVAVRRPGAPCLGVRASSGVRALGTRPSPSLAPLRSQSLSVLSSRLQTAFNLTTFALSLLLVFRTNSSYSRWCGAGMVLLTPLLLKWARRRRRQALVALSLTETVNLIGNARSSL